MNVERTDFYLKSHLVKTAFDIDDKHIKAVENLVQIPRLPGEVYELIPTTYRYYVSNMGNALKIVYDKKADIFIEHKLALQKSRNKTGNYYYDINIQLETGERIRCRLARAIVKTFLDSTFGLLYEDDKRVPNHIDYNTENNNLSNLEIKSQSGNIEDAIYNQGITVGKPIKKCYAYNIDTKELREYVSTAKCTEDIFNKDNNGWFNSYYKNKFVSNTGWTVGYDPEELKTRVRKERYRGGRKK